MTEEMPKELQNAVATGDFLSKNSHIENNGAIASFQATVQYAPANINDTTTVYIKTDTFNYGNIEIDTTKVIDLNIVHAGFNVRYNNYVYKAECNALIIEGTAHSSKGGRPYVVTITPC